MAKISNKFALYITGGRIISMLAGFVMPVLLVRVMSQSDYGLTSQFLTLYTAIYTIAAFGIHTNLFFFCSSTSKEKWNLYISNTFFLLFLFGVIVGIFLSIPIVKELVFGGSELGKHSNLIITSIALATVMNIVSPLNTIRQDKWGALLYPGFVACSRILTIVICAIYFKDINTLFYGLLVFQIIISASILLYARFRTKFILNFSIMKQQLAYSLPFGLAVALQLLSNYFDKFLCIKYLTTTEYAIYGIAFLSIPGITQIYDSLCQVNIANMSNSFRSGDIKAIPNQYGMFVKKTLSFSIPIILTVSLYAEEIMNLLYSSKYLEAAPYFRLYSLSFLTSMFGAGTILRSVGKTKMSLYAFLITCIIGLPLTYLLVICFGTLGAITGAMVNIILPRLIQMVMEIRVLRIKASSFLPWGDIWKMFAISLFALLPLIIIKMSFHFNVWLCILQASIYISVIYGFFISKKMFIVDKDYILARLRRKIQ